MAWWQYALLALVIAWGLQAYGVWRQTQHYQGVFKELRSGWSDGMLGVGAAPAKLGKGAIAMVVVDPSGAVRTVRVMQGRSVFAKFKARDELNGMSLADLKVRVDASGFDSGVGVAIAKAIEQIEKVEAQKGSVTGAASGAAFKLA
jgi:glucitol operon activator protein